MRLRKSYLPNIGRSAAQELGWNKQYLQSLNKKEDGVRQVNQESRVPRRASAHTIFTDLREIHDALTKLDSTRTNDKGKPVLDDKIKQIEAYSNLQTKLFQALAKISKLSYYAGHESFSILNKYAKATREALGALLGDTAEKISPSQASKGLTGVIGRIFNPQCEIVGN
jgi:hypothetical protein